jgi:uncharacterized membrane protein YbhN (UPF0104 family)
VGAHHAVNVDHSFQNRFLLILFFFRTYTSGRVLCFFCFEFSSGLSLAAGLLLFVGGSIAVVVPTPNGAGPWHFAIISIMVLYGVSPNNASVFALIVHSTQTLLVALLGLYALVMLQFKKSINK